MEGKEFKTIKYDDFAKLELKIGEVLECTKHPDADKLLVFKLNFGNHERTIVSGLAEFYEPSELVGKHLAAVLNLEPRKLRGIESHGMILTTEYVEDGQEFVQVIETTLPAGSIIC